MKSNNKKKDFCMFALPGMFCFFAVVIVPFLYGVYLTLTDWNGVSKVKEFHRTGKFCRGYEGRTVLEFPGTDL